MKFSTAFHYTEFREIKEKPREKDEKKDVTCVELEHELQLVVNYQNKLMDLDNSNKAFSRRKKSTQK